VEHLEKPEQQDGGQEDGRSSIAPFATATLEFRDDFVV
jgi:hypothetical protein